MIDLTLQGFLVPNILGYDPPFGTKVETTVENRGGLTTRQVNDNIMLPFAKQRAVVVSQTDATTNVEYDAKIILRSLDEITPDEDAGEAGGETLPEATLTLTLGDGGYEGCVVTILCMNASSPAVLCASGENFNLLPGTILMLAWTGQEWIQPGIYGAVWN